MTTPVTSDCHLVTKCYSDFQNSDLSWQVVVGVTRLFAIFLLRAPPVCRYTANGSQASEGRNGDGMLTVKIYQFHFSSTYAPLQVGIEYITPTYMGSGIAQWLGFRPSAGGLSLSYVPTSDLWLTGDQSWDKFNRNHAEAPKGTPGDGKMCHGNPRGTKIRKLGDDKIYLFVRENKRIKLLKQSNN